jgi:hypothetical protein
MEISSHFWLHTHLPAHLFFVYVLLFVCLSYGVLFTGLASIYLLWAYSCTRTRCPNASISFPLSLYSLLLFNFLTPKLMALGLVIASILYLVHYMLRSAVSPLLISSFIYLSQFYFVGDLYHTLACRSM